MRFRGVERDSGGRPGRNLIDRLLASPHYGERWAQHWFDVTRYADTGGMANDFERSNMWRYRDYVIRAFNDDKPYDQFVVEQLAGDELADVAALERLGGDEAALADVRKRGDYTEGKPEWIVATGFLRMGPWDNAMVSEAEARQIYLDDLVNNVGQTFLSTTMRCFKCHDHKFDPLPTRDYYRFYAAFSGDADGGTAAPASLPEENRDGFEEGKRIRGAHAGLRDDREERDRGQAGDRRPGLVRGARTRVRSGAQEEGPSRREEAAAQCGARSCGGGTAEGA